MRRSFIALAGALLSLSPAALARNALWTSPSTSASDPDTLEIRMFLVQFSPDPSSSSGITGNGTFGSDTGTFGLEGHFARSGDTNAIRHANRVLQFAQDYWHKASSGRLVIDPKVYRTVLRLPQTMNYYTLPARTSGENKTAYWNRAETRLLDLAGDAVRLAAAQDSNANPFFASLPASTSSKRKVIFACMHAGINRSTDGGTKGSAYANSQRDLLDFYITPSDFKLLASSTDTSLAKDSLGIPVTIGGLHDTLKHLMLLPEAMSQDGLNWGVAGMLNQEIGSALGLPTTSENGTRDPSPSVLGTWDLMDAGSSGGQGFLPTLPMAWHRLYLGWATAVTLKPGSAPFSRPIPAVRPGQDTVFVVPLDGGEYLLIENRQRGDNGVSRVLQLDPSSNDTHSIAIAPDSASYLLSDSLCTNGHCSPNPKRLKGYLASAGVDIGLPGSGLLIWKVNEWLLQEYLSAQVANPWQGDSLQDHYRGITLLQASGKSTLGQRLTSATGATILDYGSGSDVLPHIHRSISGGKETSRKTVTDIPSVGYVSTETSTGARTLITLTSPWPATAKEERGELSLSGDSVITPGAASLNLQITWGQIHAPQDSLYPIRLPAGLNAHSFLPGPSLVANSSWIVDSTGHVQLLDSMGRVDTRFGPLSDTLTETGTWADSIGATFTNAAKNSQTRKIAVQNLSKLLERPLGTASLGDTLAVATRKHLIFVWPRDTVHMDTASFPLHCTTAPMAIHGEGFFVADSAGRLWRATTNRLDTLTAKLPGLTQALCRSDSNGTHQIYAVNDSGHVSRYSTAAFKTTTNGLVTFPAAFPAQAGEVFSVASTDFDRDSVNDVLVLGSRGSAAILSGKDGSKFPGWPKVFARGGTSVLGDSGLPTLADLDGSGYPQILFTGTDRLWLVDKNGASPTGWPVHVTGNDPVNQSTAGKRFPAGVFGSSPLVVSLDGDATKKEVLLGSPDGQIFAFTSSGTTYAGTQSTTTSGSGASLGYSVSTWPLAAGSRTSDSTRCPWLHIFAQGGRLNSISSLQGLDLFRIDSAKTLWGIPGSSAARGFFLDLSQTAEPVTSTSLTNFHFYPNPIRSGRATVRYDLGSDARSAKLEIYDQTSYVVLQKNDLPTIAGRQSYSLDGLHLGSGVYVARLTVEFPGKTRSSWFRLAVAR